METKYLATLVTIVETGSFQKPPSISIMRLPP